MWLSALIALLTYLMSSKDTKEERKKALLTAAAAGAITYGVTEYTDWGKENLKPLDASISGAFTGDPDPAKATAATNAAKTQSGSGLWDTLKSWGPTGVSAVIGTAGVATGNKNLLILAGLAVAAILILK